MDLKLFSELNRLVNTLDEYEKNKKELEYVLEHRKHHNSISLSKGLYTMTLESDLIPTIIEYYDKKILETKELIEQFKLSKKK